MSRSVGSRLLRFIQVSPYFYIQKEKNTQMKSPNPFNQALEYASLRRILAFCSLFFRILAFCSLFFWSLVFWSLFFWPALSYTNVRIHRIFSWANASCIYFGIKIQNDFRKFLLGERLSFNISKIGAVFLVELSLPQSRSRVIFTCRF